MAHFAKVENGVVTNVVVVDNQHESNGNEYLNSIGLEGTWIQTSYNASIRKKFAAIGDTYDAKLDVFKPAKPYSKWVWDEANWIWEAPVKHPVLLDPEDTTLYDWDDQASKWVPSAQ